MIKGLLFFEEGGVQQLGEFNTLSTLIATMKQVLPELEAAELKRVASLLSDDDLQRLANERKSAVNTGDK